MVMADSDFNQDMTVEDFSRWLSKKGFSEEIRKRFEGNSTMLSMCKINSGGVH